MGHSVGAVVGASPRRLIAAAALSAAMLLLGACSTTVTGAPITATGGPRPGTVDTALLDVGNYPTRPSPPMGIAGSPQVGAIIEGQRMANNVIGPWEIDPSLISGYATSGLVLKSAEALTTVMPEEYAGIAAKHNFVAGFYSSREAKGQKMLSNAVLRFADPAAAAAAAAELGQAAQTATTIAISSASPATIPGHPDTVAGTFLFDQPEQGNTWTVLRAVTPHDTYVLIQQAQSTSGPDPAIDLIAKSIDKQGPLIDEFEPADPARLADLPIDPTGLLARTLPVATAEASVNDRAVYQPRGALHFQTNPVASSALFTRTGVDLIANGKDNVYQTRDAASAIQVVDAFTNELAVTAQPAEPVKQLPASRCLAIEAGQGLVYFCAAPAGRYAIEANSAQLLDAQQQVAAQYTILIGP